LALGRDLYPRKHCLDKAVNVGSIPTAPTKQLALVQRIEHRASTSRMWVRFLHAGPICSYSIKALHYIGNVETQDRYLVGAPRYCS
jgi:hypothetical protein